MWKSPDGLTSYSALLTDQDRETYWSLSDSDRERIFAGECVEAPNGITFVLHDRTASVAGRELRVVVARPKRPDKGAGVAAHKSLCDAQAAVSALLARPGTPPELQDAFSRYAQARNRYMLELGGWFKSELALMDRRLGEARKLPAMLASESARLKAAKAHGADNPKVRAKAAALELWKERHAGKHPKLGTVEQFATEVMRRWPQLKSAKVICGWSAKWAKEAKAGKPPTC